MNEMKMIRTLAGIHGLTPFGADAEQFGNMLYSMDGFSKTEDFFTFTPPFTVGQNMAAAACSDLLACGVKPDFLIQSWNLDDSENEAVYEQMARGVESVLRHYGAVCIGGDMGSASPWNWTAVAGARLAGTPVRRIASRRVPFDLYLSGPLGDANFAAFRRLAMPLIELRDPVSSGALFATDTSGGFFDALENFRRVNPGLTLRLETLPYADLPDLPFPREILLIGGVGEYELLYAVPAGTPADGIRIGHGDFTGQGVYFSGGGMMKNPPPDYRAIPETQWVQATQRYYCEVFV